MMPDTIWWKRGVVYQIYPRSFQDSNGDGVGDLAGIRSRLDYLEWLGVDAIWISPIFPSPMADFGYDVSDYCGIDPLFGSLAGFDALMADAHKRGMKVILDYVPNHTSDRHPWFQEARSSRQNPKRDWYIWRDAAPDGGAPNNWVSNFGGSGWEWDEATGQYYYHAFLKEQPDLNWRNPQLREAMHEALRFWMRRGVDGFRVDVMWHLMKDADFTDDPLNPGYTEGMPDIRRVFQVNSADRPEVHEVVRGIREVIDEFDDRVLIGEIYLPVERLVAYYGADLKGAHLPFNFQLIHAVWNAPTLGGMIREYEAALPEDGWPNWVLGNHDQKRIRTRVGAAQARVAAMLLLTLRGTPTVYYGDEIGMADVPVAAEELRDPWALNEPGLGVGRDPQRTPMQWSPSPHAGFSTSRPWLPLDADYQSVNVEALRDDPTSMLTLYRELIRLRRSSRALRVGNLRLINDAGDVLVYERKAGAERKIVCLNLGSSPQDVTDLLNLPSFKVLLSTRPDAERTPVENAPLELLPDEGVVIESL
jgi:alpha-glucosidase